MNLKMKRVTSALFAFVMVITMIPLGTIIATSANVTNFSDDPTQMLGLGYNAIDGKTLEEHLIPTSWIDLDSDETKVFVYGNRGGVLEQYGNASYSKTALEFLSSMGIDYSNTTSAGFTMGKIKAGVESKFSSSFDLSEEKTTSELYYSYIYKAVCNRYVLGSEYSNYLSDSFIADIDALAADPSDMKIAAFFNKYGTHMLTSFETGGEVSLTAWAYSTSEKTDVLSELESSVSANVGIGSIANAETSTKLALRFSSSNESSEYESEVDYRSVGGTPFFTDTTLPGELNINTENLENWVNTLADNPAFISTSSTWVAVWDVLPKEERYNLLRNELQEYFLLKTSSVNSAFLKRFCSFSNYISLQGYTYISSDNYVYQNVPFDGNNDYVAPGSIVIVSKDTLRDSVYSIDQLDYEINAESSKTNSGYVFDLDINDGAIKVHENATEGDKIIVDFKYGDIVVDRVTFIVKPESSLFSGGYGTPKRPYLISTPQDVENIAANSDKHFLLVNDIDFKGEKFAGIPNFSGTLDGNGYSIYGFYSSYGIDIGMTHHGFIRQNTGTIRNLTIGKNGYIGQYPGLAGINKATGVTAQQFSVCIKLVQYETKVSNNRMSVGALIGWNEGIVDNCHVENAYVYAQLDDRNDNDTSYVYAGMVGTNHGNGIIVRSTVSNSYLEAYAVAKEDSGDDCVSYVGGICGRNGGTVSHCASYQNCFRSDARGNGKGDNKAYPVAVVGGIVGRVSNIHEAQSENTRWHVDYSAAYSNLYSVYYSEGGATSGYACLGTIIGQAKEQDSNGSVKTLLSCYSDLESNQYATCTDYLLRSLELNPVGGLEGIENGDGYVTKSTLSALMTTVDKWEHFAITTQNNQQIVTIPQPWILSILGGRNDYVVNDFPDPQDICISSKYQDGNNQREFKAYVATEDSFEFQPAMHSVFKLENFTTTTATEKLETCIIAYGGLSTTDYQPNVHDKAIEVLSITQLPYNTDYYVGEELDLTGLSLEIIYNTGETESLEDGVTVSGYDKNILGDQEITVSLGTITTTFTVTVHRIAPADIVIASGPDKSNYAVGEPLDIAGLVVELIYNNGKVERLSNDDIVCTGFDSSSEGSKEITLEYSYFDDDLNKNCTLTTAFYVNVGTITSIEIETLPTKLSYYTSEKKLDLSGLSLKVTYSNGVSKTVSETKTISADNYNLSVSGLQDVTIEYQGFTDTFEIEVLPVTLTSVTIKTLPKTQFYIPDQFTASGLALTLNYVDGSTRDVYKDFSITVDGYDEGIMPTFLVKGTKRIIVAYEEGGIKRSTSYDINIAERDMQSIQIVQSPLKDLYKVNEKIDTTGMMVYGIFNNGDVIEVKDYTVHLPDLSTPGEKTVRISYMGTYQTEFVVSVLMPERIYVAEMPTKSTYFIGETFDSTGLVVKAVYWDYSEVILDQNEYTLSEPSLTTLGSEMVNIQFANLSTHFYAQIKEFEVPEDAPKIIIDTYSATIGKTVTVDISLKNNPGIASMKLNVSFDQTILELKEITYNGAMTGQSQLPQNMDSPVILNWYNGWNNCEDDLLFATLTFEVLSTAEHDSDTDISVTYNPEDIYNILENNVTFYVEGGDIHIIEYLPGDINNDGEVNNKDVTRLFQYLSGWDVEVCEKALDVNGDGNVNNKDMTRLFQYLSNWDVEIF